MKPKFAWGMLILVGLLLVGSEGVWAREKGKEDKKQAEKQMKQARYEQAVQALDQQSFVLVADLLNLKGQAVHVTGQDNFVRLDQGDGMLQLALCPDHLDQNGVGGLTLAGRLFKTSSWTTPKGELVYRYEFTGRMSSRIEVSILPGDNYARASIGIGQATFWGRIISADESDSYKGQAFEPTPVGMLHPGIMPKTHRY